MGAGGIPIKDIPKKEYYYFKDIEGPYFHDEAFKVKLEPSLINIDSYKDIQIKLIYYDDSKKTIQKSCGETELGKFDYETKKIRFESFFLLDYHFEKEMPIEFRIFGDINATIYTSLPSIMGARGQKFQKEIDGTDIILEVKGYSYQNKIYSNLKLDVEINGKIAEKALKYSIIAKGSDERPRDQKLYLSELQVGLKSEKRINFKQSVIPDIYICSDDNYKTNKICIELRDCQKDKVIGKHTCYLNLLILNKYTIKFDSSISGTLFIDPIKNYSFIDYLRGGMQINLSIAIDFTASLTKTKLHGPTYFHHFIEKINNKVLKQVEEKNFDIYHILMILTDGIIEDTDATINALVEASFLPISVIIIGIGNADFTNMNILDADDVPLYDDNDRKASRDLVQFVPFNKYKNDPIKLAEEVLEEIPRQIVEYYQHQNISPKKASS